ncbi:PREDICTED: NADH dehydrogenase [ubiquinone] flavoprotein 3, mitochondrial isoform X1 [Chinchilla lanigera]|uniref:NADH:ubiquinone oxidoreductase subunit V3 n=1 Tax=Chinchilla lanigera TaxID=34839 RepID=A0A8C2YQ70_CHILA|nr:PREDICTED: NADH dehydrogenase [ubiquinone] flavoprotein 3, mitochondrial isoform X1 [Chinchilla lanigera]
MAARLLLRRGRARALKTVLLEVPVFRGPASTASLSAPSGKNEKELPPNPKRQSPPKNVEEPQERAKLLATHPAAAAPPSSSLPASSPAAGSRSRAVAGAQPGGRKLLTEEGLPKALPRKTLVAFPHKAPAPFRVQGRGTVAHPDAPKATDDSSTSSSSSSSSSSDSESDEERDIPEAGPRVGSKGRGGSPRPEATQRSENRTPTVAVSAKEKSEVQKPHTDVSYSKRASQPKKKSSPAKPVQGREEAAPEGVIPRSQIRGEVLKQSAKEEQSQKTCRPDELAKASRQPLGVEGISPDHAKARLSTRLGGSLSSTPGTQEAARRGPQEPEPGVKLAPPQVHEEMAGQQVGGGRSEAPEEILEDQATVRSQQPAPVQAEEVQTAGLKPREGAAPPPEVLGDTQESTPAPAPTEPYDNTTYKNLQHHDYSTYTFLDLNLDLSKFRQPQPSSGRESPRH